MHPVELSPSFSFPSRGKHRKDGASDDPHFWLSLACLPAAPSFRSSPWEYRHYGEIVLMDSALAVQSGTGSSLEHDGNTIRLLPRDRPIHGSTFQVDAVREVELVSRCMYALQGIPVAVTELELLAKIYSHQAADRSLHRMPTLWQRSASTNAVGKLLAIMAQAGRMRCQLQEFVEFFLTSERRGNAIACSAECFREFGLPAATQKRRGRVKAKHVSSTVASTDEGERKLYPPFTLVNQAFSAAVKSILQGHLAALNTVTASVLHRRATDSQISTESSLRDKHIGPVIGLDTADVTLLELYLHTSELRLQLQVLASLCLNDTNEQSQRVETKVESGYWPVEGDLALIDVPTADSPVSDFEKFPKGADLLTYLYKQLKGADVLHVELLQYLFSRACQPYLVFIQSWLYCAIVKDPYKEFIVDETFVVVGASSFQEHPLNCLKKSVSVPCFLEGICTPLLRAGQQLQVLLRLAETGSLLQATHSFASGSKLAATHAGSGTLEGALKCWTDFSSDKSCILPVLVFSKERLEELTKERERTQQELMRKLDMLFARLKVESQEVDALEQWNFSADVWYKSTEEKLRQSNKGKVLSNGPFDCSTAGIFDSTLQNTDITGIDKAVEDKLTGQDAVNLEKKSEKPYGGGTWELYLKEIKEQKTGELGLVTVDMQDKLEIPLEAVLDKCVAQEVVSQYHCISYFMVRLLREIFGLPEHLAALRRYFFMERGDWADSFTAALYQHVWYPSGAQQRQLELQAMLEDALQNSSCKEDEYAERLVVHIETGRQLDSPGTETSPPDRDDFGRTYINKSCVTAFDFITLGYNVGWPINLILTADSFKLYNSIFNFLVRIKLTIHALGDVWRCLKVLSHASKKGKSMAGVEDKQDRIRMLILFRQQIAHFITTLQDYVESQLLYTVWSRFLNAVDNEAKDLQDLDAIHKAYLTDAVHQCFLSDNMRPVKACIDEIMQCLLNLGSCLYYSEKQGKYGHFDIGNDKVYSVVLEVKCQYENSVRELHRLRSESHSQLSLGYFWMRLDFNGFVEDTCSRVSSESYKKGDA